MRFIYVACGTEILSSLIDDSPAPVEQYKVRAVPTRKELRFLDQISAEELPVDPTPSLDEIAAQPDVEHLGAPSFAPQIPNQPLRVIVHGSDAALSAVLTRMMRADYMWAEVAYIPTDPTSPASVNWGITADNAVQNALHGSVRPVPTIRTDTSTVVAGSATLTHLNAQEYIGEIVVDSDVLVLRDDQGDSARFFGQFGARLVPMTEAPGIVAAPLVTPRISEGKLTQHDPRQMQAWFDMPILRWRTRGKAVPTNRVDGSHLLTGRAVQSGGLDIQITIDGIDHPRPVKRVTFYRHLRDMQAVRPD
ncbi:hypothetical protein QP027_09965 [Corynebacterium breve]|uniref:Methionyl-tRNA formyltransferase n=1 Tax=Corynebacterium breve TaxID=3049799 RepID=A0ABY8VFK5_9CORY|nr:hypothetical protein [Corynebacterium breve]WIM67418.1 hypothetical protein QP027_09965 [Corynebacterium breve]